MASAAGGAQEGFTFYLRPDDGSQMSINALDVSPGGGALPGRRAGRSRRALGISVLQGEGSWACMPGFLDSGATTRPSRRRSA